MADYAIVGHGAVLSVGGTTIAQIVNIDGPNQSVGDVNGSSMDSANAISHILPGFYDVGDLTAEMNYNALAGQNVATLQGLITNRATHTILITMDDDEGTAGTNSVFSCAGFISGLGSARPFDDVVKQTVTIRMTGAITLTNAG